MHPRTYGEFIMRIAALARMVALMSLSVLAAITLCIASDQTASADEVIAFLDEAVAYVDNNGGFRKTNQSKCLYTINIIIFDV